MLLIQRIQQRQNCEKYVVRAFQLNYIKISLQQRKAPNITSSLQFLRWMMAVLFFHVLVCLSLGTCVTGDSRWERPGWQQQDWWSGSAWGGAGSGLCCAVGDLTGERLRTVHLSLLVNEWLASVVTGRAGYWNKRLKMLSGNAVPACTLKIIRHGKDSGKSVDKQPGVIKH